ncbi:PQ loop repeat-domain-containing protein [Sphaerosporella brunnea]|uniref:PQ loop repeat-domain-containing protein n=1 Tax=Sphaerosporella brunnea TaxID=1250544 RepID=A0A5J5F6W7_9PEZI|nr:PQ loop repeat-domain-containing protein [Sphaerosporella brunnea]
MFPPSQNGPFELNLQALSGVAGSISIACWIVVFTPQILQNLRRGSAEGLSITFLLIWLAGDVFNIVGAVAQGVLPTMVILAAYYTLADVVLLAQCFWYNSRGQKKEEDEEHLVEAGHLNPATPLLKGEDEDVVMEMLPQQPAWMAALSNAFAVILVCTAGALGWLLTFEIQAGDALPPKAEEGLTFSPLGQTFGYLCAFLYLASRIPQILLNARRQSCEGVSILFFIFACAGNVTYVLSILANTGGGGEEQGGYSRYLAVNASWLLGSVGTLVLDAIIFAQFFVYGDGETLEV